MIQPPQFIETFLSLPIPLLGLIIFAVWGGMAVLMHRLVVPAISGSDGHALGTFEAEVASQVGIVLGLLLSFNAVTVWEQSSAARDATLAEASALREVADMLPELPAEQRDAVRASLRDYLHYVIEIEWPALASSQVGLNKPASLRRLARLGRAGTQDLHDPISAAVHAREDRIRIATARMLPARWTIVIVLGALALLAIGLVHAEHRRARAVALAMVAFGIASCFVVLLVQARPFLGSLALQPAELRALAQELSAPVPPAPP